MAVLQFILHFLRRGLQSQVLCLEQQSLPANQLIDRPLSILLDQKWHQHRRVLPILLRLLFRHVPRRRVNLLHGNVLAIHLGNNALARRAA